MNNRRFSPKVKQILTKSRDEALRLGHNYIGTEHILLGILSDSESLAFKVLKSLEIDATDLRQSIEDEVSSKEDNSQNLHVGNLPLNAQAEKVLKVTFLEAKQLKSEEICPEHIFLSMLKNNDNTASKVLHQFDIDYDIYKAELEFVKQEQDFTSGNTSPDTGFNQGPTDPEDTFEEEDFSKRRQVQNLEPLF